MKKKFTIIISVICLVCILMLATFSACNGEKSEELDYDVVSFPACNHLLGGIETRINRIVRIDSLRQLTKFCNEAKIPINDKNNLDDYDSDLYKKLRNYDISFFMGKTLFILMKFGYSYEPTRFGNVTIEDNVLTANLLNDHDPFKPNFDYWGVEYAFVSLIEIKSDEVRCVNKMEIKEYYCVQ